MPPNEQHIPSRGSAILSRLWHPATLLGIFIIVQVIAWAVLPRLGVIPGEGNEGWRLASAGILEDRGYYSPVGWGITRIWQAVFGANNTSGFIFLATGFGLGLAGVWACLQTLFADRRLSGLTIYLTLCAPYLVWSVYVARDVALDMAAFGGMMLLGARILRAPHPTWGLVAVFGLAGSASVLIRESNLAVVVVLLFFLLLSRALSLRQFSLAIIILGLGLTPLLTWNSLRVGAPVLSTRIGLNLYFGNHPHYLDGHPVYDIDVFLGERVSDEARTWGIAGADPITVNQAFTQRAMDQIMADMPATAYRIVLKSWWWIGPTRIPQTDTQAILHPLRAEISIIRTSSPAKDLIYVLHRLVVLGGWLLCWPFARANWRATTFLILPIIALIPVIALTFPDTRFRLAYDAFSHGLAVAGWFGLWQVIRRVRARLATPAQG